jgi:hypothetical protein
MNVGGSSVNQTFSFLNLTGLDITRMKINRTSSSENMNLESAASLSNNYNTFAKHHYISSIVKSMLSLREGAELEIRVLKLRRYRVKITFC